MKVGLFNPYLDTMGGGERYFLTAAEYFLKRGDEVDLFWKDDESADKIYDRFGIDIKGARFAKNIFNGENNRWLKYLETLKYDLIFFLSDGSLPISFARKNIIHFQVPFTDIGSGALTRFKLFNATVVCNSRFTKSFVDQTYHINSRILYPPVDVENFIPGKKENIILAVGRFFAPLHPKKQDILVEAFKKMKTDWQLVLIGGVFGTGSKKLVESLKIRSRGYNIKIITDSSLSELKDYYSKAKLFWHAAGYGEDLEAHPERAEHFGMTTVEAMSAGCVPLVFSGGGQREIVEDGGSGCLWSSVNELMIDTQGLINNEAVRKNMAKKSIQRAKAFSKEKFFESLDKIV